MLAYPVDVEGLPLALSYLMSPRLSPTILAPNVSFELLELIYVAVVLYSCVFASTNSHAFEGKF